LFLFFARSSLVKICLHVLLCQNLYKNVKKREEEFKALARALQKLKRLL